VNDLEIFINRLSKIGIAVTFISNYPWIYLDTVNGKKIKGRYMGNHGFTAFWLTIRRDDPKKYRITDISIVFDKIRETLKQ
jgi:hypothetical protein